MHLAAVVLSIWIVCLGYLLFDGHGHGVVVGIGMLIAAAGLALPLLGPRWLAFSSPAVAYGMTIAFAGLFALQFVEEHVPLFGLILLAIAAFDCLKDQCRGAVQRSAVSHHVDLRE